MGKSKQWQSFGWESQFTVIITNIVLLQKKDYFNYGGRSEFFGYSLEDQTLKLKKSIEIFKEKM